MDEVKQIRAATNPAETLLVVDAMTGQDAVNTAKAFNDAVGVTGIVMTRMDGDARGGAALSMRAITGAPIKLVGVGEKLDALEDFHPERVAGRILGMGDVVGLVERAAETIDQAEAEKLARKMAKGKFDLEDYATQLKQISKMGSISSIIGMLPGAAKLQQQIGDKNLDQTVLKRQAAIISSMTMKERRVPDIIKASRKKRIAAGSGTSVQEVNRLLKQFDDMSTMMKRMNKLGQKGLMRHGLSALMPQGRRRLNNADFRTLIYGEDLDPWVSRSASPAPAPRSARTTTSWWPTAAARATAASSRSSAPTTRCCRRSTPSAFACRASASCTG